jgi:hypothetical protein
MKEVFNSLYMLHGRYSLFWEIIEFYQEERITTFKLKNQSFKMLCSSGIWSLEHRGVKMTWQQMNWV